MRDHPVADSLAGGLPGVMPGGAPPLRLQFGAPAGSEWRNVAELCLAPQDWIAAAQSYIADRAGAPVGSSVAVSHISVWYFGALGAWIGGVWSRHRRVLDISPANTWVLLTPGGWPAGFALSGCSLLCCADDPAAEHPDAVVTADDELKEHLRASFAAHAGPLVAGLGPAGRLGRRTMWGFVTDGLIDGLAGRVASPAGRASAREILPRAIGPYIGPAAFRRLTLPQADPQWIRQSFSCCLAYKTASTAPTCLGCPRLSDAQRVDRLQPVELSPTCTAV